MILDLPRPFRRLLVAAFIGGTLGGLAVRVFAPGADVLAYVLQILGPICGAALFGWGWPHLYPENLDERQHQVRYDVYFRAYLVLVVLVLAAPLLVTLLGAVSEPAARGLIDALLAALREPGDFVMALLALVPLVGLLPWAMLAWRQPEPLADA